MMGYGGIPFDRVVYKRLLVPQHKGGGGVLSNEEFFFLFNFDLTWMITVLICYGNSETMGLGRHHCD